MTMTDVKKGVPIKGKRPDATVVFAAITVIFTVLSIITGSVQVPKNQIGWKYTQVIITSIFEGGAFIAIVFMAYINQAAIKAWFESLRGRNHHTS